VRYWGLGNELYGPWQIGALSAEAYVAKAREVDRPVHVAYDEWNVWFREREASGGLEERYTLADALAVATYVNVFVRHCRLASSTPVDPTLANLPLPPKVIVPMASTETRSPEAPSCRYRMLAPASPGPGPRSSVRNLRGEPVLDL
jgi:hypothetical protein